MKKLWLIILLVAVVALGVYMFMGDDSSGDNGDSQPVQIEERFDSKVVYTTDMSANREALMADCELRGGEFNECGSICPSDADMCAEVCAYTCDNIDPEKAVINGDNATSSATSSDMMEDESTSTMEETEE